MESGRDSRGGEGLGDANCEPFELQPSVLDAVDSLCPEREAEEIWRVVGPSLVEQARDLLEEARIHLEIWRELSRDADHATPRALPEPPMVRQRLIQEIRFLANHLQARPGSSTIDSCAVDRSREVLDYALTTPDLHNDGCGSCCSRPPSAVSSRDGRDTPLRRATPSSRDGSQSSVLSCGSRLSVEGVSLADIDSSVQHLRESLEEEISQRRQDIVFLQECSEGESTFLLTCPPPPLPSLRELREVGTLLERKAMSGTSRGPPPSPNSHCGAVLPRPPPGECPTRSQISSARIRRASGAKLRPIQSNPDPITSTPHETGTDSPQPQAGQRGRSEVFSAAGPRYPSLTSSTTHCLPIT